MLVCASQNGNPRPACYNLVGDISAPEPRPLYQVQEPPERALRFVHANSKYMRMPVRPAHPAAYTARCQVGPLHVAEVFGIKTRRQCDPVILKAVDGTVLGVEERSMFGRFANCL